MKGAIDEAISETPPESLMEVHSRLGALGIAMTGTPYGGFAASAMSATPPSAVPLPPNTSTAHYTQTSSGLVHEDLYNSPVALPSGGIWQYRDPNPQPVAGEDVIAPAHVPFGLQMATESNVPALVSATSEDGITLRLGLPQSGASQIAATQAQINDGTVVYPGALSAASFANSTLPSGDVTVRPTISGFSLGMVLRSASQANSFHLALSLDSRTHAVQDPSGAIIIQQAIPLYADDGTMTTVEQEPEFIIGRPLVHDSGSNLAAATATGPASLSVSAAGGSQQLTMSIESGWLQDSARVFPIYLDVPVTTADAAYHTGLFGTVNSCSPSTPAPPTQVVVGSQGSCTYHGQLYFDVSSILPTRTIVSATLNLYTPSQTGPSGIELYPDAPPPHTRLYAPASWQPPSWNTAPASASGASSIAQNGSNGHWQSWDVTNLVQQWVARRRATNAGITLVRNGAPLLLASPLGVGADGSAFAPFLSIDLAPLTYDQAGNIWGMNGFPIAQAPHTLTNDYTRLSLQLACQGGTPSFTTIDNELLSQNLFIPIVNFAEDYSCSTPNTPADWSRQLNYFLRQLWARILRNGVGWSTIYFEIDNEPDTHSNTFGNYPQVFTAAAQSLYQGMNTFFPPNLVSFWIITGGVSAPVAQYNGCSNINVLNTIDEAIADAEIGNVPYSVLGVAVHPYSYATSLATDPNLWQNYRKLATLGNPCFALDGMISLWTTYFSGIPLMFTETNYTSIGDIDNQTQVVTDSEGSYLVDLFTWMFDKNYYLPSQSPIRVIWFTGNDFTFDGGQHTHHLGIYTATGAEKTTQINGGVICPFQSMLNGLNNPLSIDYQYSTYKPCY